MAVVTIQQSVAALYVAVFNRAADAAGLNAWTAAITSGKQTFAQVAAGFAAHEVFTAGIGTLNNTDFVSALYQNILGSAGDAAGIANWTNQLNAGKSKADVAALFVQAALTVDIPAMLAAGSLTAAEAAAATVRQQTLTNKADVGIYFAQTLGNASNLNPLTVSSSKAGLEADPIYNASKAAIANVTNTPASVAAAKDAIAVAAGSSNPAQALLGGSFTLTTGVDTLVGGPGTDVFNATQTATSNVLGGLDSVDGGAGIDTLNIADTATGTGVAFTTGGAAIKNVENINISTTGTLAGLNLKTGTTGATNVTLKSQDAGAAAHSVTVADTTDVAVTVAAGTVGVTGGKVVSVTNVAAAVDTVAGDALTAVTLKGAAATSAVNNTVAGLGITGTTLKSVTIDAGAGAIGVNGNAIDTVTLKNEAVASTVTVTNTVSTALTVNVDNAGYTAIGGAVAAVGVTAGAAATTINLNATGSKSNVVVAGAAVKTLNITGTADLTLSAPITTATKIDGSTATGKLTLGVLDAATVTANTGSGNDSLTLSATAKAAVNTGAGNDTVTLAAALAAGSTVNLGAGDDKLLVTTGSVIKSTATDVTVIDGGDGIDTVAAALINAGNAAQFKNFEHLDASSAATLDVALMTGSSITGATLSGGAGGATLSNLAAGADLTVSGANAGTTTLAVANALTNTADVFNIKFDGAAVAAVPGAANVTAGIVSLANIETINVSSAGATNTWNSLTLSDDAAKSIVVTGSQNLDLSIGQTVAATKVALTSIDGSAATGKLSITDTSLLHIGSALAIKGGSAADTITVGASGATVTGGAGNDVFKVGAAMSNVTAGAGATNAADLAGSLVKTTITDFTKGDAIVLGVTATSNTFSTTKVDVSAAQNLGDALDLAAAGVSAAATALTKWFVWGADTYVVQDASAATTLAATDTVVKLSGVLDLSTSAVVHGAVDTLTFA